MKQNLYSNRHFFFSHRTVETRTHRLLHLRFLFPFQTICSVLDFNLNFETAYYECVENDNGHLCFAFFWFMLCIQLNITIHNSNYYRCTICVKCHAYAHIKDQSLLKIIIIMYFLSSLMHRFYIVFRMNVHFYIQIFFAASNVRKSGRCFFFKIVYQKCLFDTQSIFIDWKYFLFFSNH